jgi:hypothetical protein
MSGALPAKYDEQPVPESLPESPFSKMAQGKMCVQAEGFKYKGRIIIPKSAERNSTAGRVVDSYPGCDYKRGERVLYSQFAGYLFNFKGASGMRVMGEEEVLGRLNEEVELSEDE